MVNLYTNTLKKGERTVLLEERYAMGRNLIPPYWKILSNNLCDLHLLYSHADPLITTRVCAKKRDYAASAGLLRTIDDDLKATQPADKTTSYDDILYSVFIDNADADVNMGDGRFFGGILIDKSQSSLKDGLFELNGVDASKMDNSDMKMTPYEVGDLPSVRAALAVFPYTGGFVSALLHNYKVSGGYTIVAFTSTYEYE